MPSCDGSNCGACACACNSTLERKNRELKSENAHLSTLFEKNSQKTPLTNMNQGNMNVSDRQYAANVNNQTKIYDYKKESEFLTLFV